MIMRQVLAEGPLIQFQNFVVMMGFSVYEDEKTQFIQQNIGINLKSDDDSLRVLYFCLGMEEVVEVWINFFGSPTIDLHDEPFCYLYLYMDYIFGNETEARTFSKAQGWEETTLEISHLPKASQKHKRITVITQGADPVSVAEDEKIKLYPMILLPKDKLVDTNGAGDAFVGGLLSQLVKQKPIK
ncbi:hypothetical protein JHK82_039288 [Glycine max]|nr:hypothetical protein JHK86_039466 [Glycine max]KAG4965070.1 hypothetical protein JHK85_040045 [Glycine max]KAG5110065.1 hypothetical protein JHK82_039288 [Glycine max]